MDGKSSKKRAVALSPPRKGDTKKQTLMSMWGLNPPSIAPLSEIQATSGTAELKPHPFLLPRSVKSNDVEDFSPLPNRRWLVMEAAVPGLHVNWADAPFEALQVSLRQQPAMLQEEFNNDDVKGFRSCKEMVATGTTVELLEQRELEAVLLREEWSLQEGASECFRRANEVLPQEDSVEVAIARAGLMTQEGRLEQEEWVYESEEQQIEQWLREWGAEAAEEDDDEFRDENLGALALEGPVGSGKSGMLARAAARTGWNILEVNGGDGRSGKLLQAMVSEATRSGRAQQNGRTMLVLEDCAVDLGDAGFSAAVECILGGARVPVAVVLEDARVPERWPVQRVVRTTRPRHKPRALLWLMLATLVARQRVLESVEALLVLQRLDWDLRAALLLVQLQHSGPLWSWSCGMPSCAGASPHSALAAVADPAQVGMNRAVREAIVRKTRLELVFQYWPMCVKAPLQVAELISLADTMDEMAMCGLSCVAASWCAGPLVGDEEVMAFDPAGERAEALPRALLAGVSLHGAELDLLGYAGMLGRFEGTGRRQTSYLARVCPLLNSSDRAKLVALATFAKE